MNPSVEKIVAAGAKRQRKLAAWMLTPAARHVPQEAKHQKMLRATSKPTQDIPPPDFDPFFDDVA